MASYSSALSLGAKNSIVAFFKDLVDKASLSEAEKATNNILNRVESSKVVSYTKSTSLDIYRTIAKKPISKRKIAEFTQELYDKAINLPEAQSITFEYVTTVVNYKHGLFKGGNIYKDYNGTLESTDNAEKLGWIYIDNTNNEYCLFTKDNSSFIIALSDFEPKPIIADFYPLYEKLKSSQYSKADSIINDACSALSLVASYRAVLSGAMSNTYAAKSLLMNEFYNPISNFAEMTRDTGIIGVDISSSRLANFIDTYRQKEESSTSHSNLTSSTFSKDYNKNNKGRTFTSWEAPIISPEQVLPGYAYFDDKNKNGYISSSTSLILSNKESSLANFDLTLVQAVIYDSPDNGKYIRNVLCCYQQPETVSYTASSQFESPQPRGSQIPFNFYQCANAITLNFTLKWHIDEVRAMHLGTGEEDSKKRSRELCLQDIADLAERFTRPVNIGGSHSILPRSVYVILPGITRRGYMTEAQISFSGDLTGTTVDFTYSDKTQATDRIQNTMIAKEKVTKIGYQYTQIEISFSLLVTDDVKLHGMHEKGMYICSSNDLSKLNEDSVIEHKEDNKNNKDTKSNKNTKSSKDTSKTADQKKEDSENKTQQPEQKTYSSEEERQADYDAAEARWLEAAYQSAARKQEAVKDSEFLSISTMIYSNQMIVAGRMP